MKASTTQAAARASRRRPRAALGVAALCATAATMLFSATAAPAAITTGTVDAASGFPFSYTDATDGLALQQCQDGSAFCVETPRPDVNAPISVPENFSEDGEGFWWLAEATVPNAGTGQARFAKESAFANEAIAAGDQVSFSRIRFRFQGLVAGDTYRVTHPYGVTELVAEPDPGAPGTGRINSTDDVGCITPPCGAFPAIAGDPITTFLRWDASSPQVGNSGYIGDPNVLHTVQGSPLGTNFVQLDRLLPPALPGGDPIPQLVGRTDEFLIQGKIAGAAPGPAPHLGMSDASLFLGNREVGSPSAPRQVTITNHGTADLHVGSITVAGLDASDFAIVSDDCSGATLTPTQTCAISVQFLALHADDRAAFLAIPSDSLGNPHRLDLVGHGTAGAAPAGGSASAGGGSNLTTIIRQLIPASVPAGAAGAVAGVNTRAALRVSGLTLARRISITRARARGLRVAMTLPSGTRVVRLAVYRSRNGLASGQPLVRVLKLPARSGRYVVNLRSRALLRSLRPGRYAVQVTPGRSLDDRGRTSSLAFTITP
jgi:hypothetical protein